MDKKTKIILFVSLVAIFILTIAHLYTLLKSLPLYEMIFAGCGTILPFLTQLYLSISYFIRNYPILLMPFILLGFMVCMVLPFVMENKQILPRIYLIIAIFLFVSYLLLHLAIKLPIIRCKRVRKSMGLSSEEIDAKINDIKNKYKRY